MRNIFKTAIPAVLVLLCLCAPQVSFARNVIIAGGVRYDIVPWSSVIISGFVEGAHTATILPTLLGYPTQCADVNTYDAPETIIFAEGITSIDHYTSALASDTIRRIEVPSTYQPERDDEYPDSSFYWLRPPSRLETVKLPATLSEEDVMGIVQKARYFFDIASYTLHDVNWYGGSYDILANRTFSRIEIDKDHPTLYDVDGVVFRKGTDELVACLPGRQGVYDVPQGTRSIGASAFANCEQLESITIPRSVTEIGESAFEGCAALRTVQLPPTLRRIGARAFDNCASLYSIILPDGVQVGKEAFYHCIGLRSAYIPGVRSVIDAKAFYKCHPDLVLYAQKDTDGYKAAAAGGVYWAEAGGVRQMLPNPREIHTRVAIVDSADEKKPLPLYEAPSEETEIVGRYAVGTPVDVLEADGDWARVRLYQAEGFMPLAQLHFVSSENDLEKITEVETQRLYSAPSPDAPAREVAWGRYEVAQRFGTWYLLDVEGEPSYVRVRDVSVFALNLERRDIAVACDKGAAMRAKLYREPSYKSECLGYYYNGTQVEILERYVAGAGDVAFHYVLVDGKEGYMADVSIGLLWHEWLYYGN